MNHSYLLTKEQVEFRDSALVKNLRLKFPNLGNYSDSELVKAYDEWFWTEVVGKDSEEGFQEFLGTVESYYVFDLGSHECVSKGFTDEGLAQEAARVYSLTGNACTIVKVWESKSDGE